MPVPGPVSLVWPYRPTRTPDPQRRTFLWSHVLYVALLMAALEVLPLWALAGAVPLVYVRLALALHELMHSSAPHRLGAFFRLAVVLETPWALGYREHRVLHLRHHRFNAGPGDPERDLIAASPARALWLAMLVPERSLLAWVREKGLRSALGPGHVLRAVLFVSVAWLAPAAFAVYWVMLRLSIGFSGFCFHHLLHARPGRLGTFALPGGERTLRWGMCLFGQQPMLILRRHRAHHLWPQIPVDALPDLPDDLELPPGGLGLVRAHLVHPLTPCP